MRAKDDQWKRLFFLRVPLEAVVLAAFFLVAHGAYARPPTPPVQLTIPLPSKAPETVKVSSGTITVPVRVQSRLDPSTSLSVRVTVDSIKPRAGARPKPVFESRLSFSAARVAELQIAIPIGSTGAYEVEFWVGPTGGDGAIDRELRYIEVSPTSTVTIFKPGQYFRAKGTERQDAFKVSVSKNPSDPDLGLLSEPLRSTTRSARPWPDDHSLVQIRPSPLPPFEKAYVTDRSDKSWSAADALSIRGRILFVDFDGVQRPLVNATIYVYDSDTGPDDYLGATITGWDGRFTFSVNNDDGWGQNGRDIFFKVALENTRFRVQDCGGWDTTYTYRSGTRSNLSDGVVDFGSLQPDASHKPSHVFMFLNRAWNFAQVAHDPGFVDACYPEDDGTFWDHFWEEIKIEGKYNDGPDVVTHEYGHALMWYAYDSESPSEGGDHSFDDVDQDSSLAWAEGFATGFAMAVCPDGQYNWHEGSSEGTGEYPACNNQSDSGRSIERYSSSNRAGFRNEGRVAAWINDLLDAPNDDNGGNENLGRNDLSDQNSASRLSFRKLYHDTLWGSFHWSVTGFASDLFGEISNETQLSLARRSYNYNWMGVYLNICVASKVATSTVPAKDAENMLDGLRALRDHALKTFPGGRRLMSSYYRNSPELALLLLRDKASLESALKVVRFFSARGHILADHDRLSGFAARGEALVPDDIANTSIELAKRLKANASKELVADIDSAMRVLESVRGLSFVEVERRLVGNRPQQDKPRDIRVTKERLNPASEKANQELEKVFPIK